MSLRSSWRKHVGRSVVVQTETVTLLGDLETVNGDWLTLQNALIGEPRGRTSMDGLVVVPLRRVVWVQVT